MLFHSAIISWSANTEPDVAGYRIYYGTDPLVLSLAYDTLSAAVLTNTFLTLPSYGQWYFNVTAYDTSNNESLHSATVTKQIIDDGPSGGCF